MNSTKKRHNVPALDLTGTTCIWGQSESGKTYLAMRMVAMAKPSQVVVIDPHAAEGFDAPGVLQQLESGSRQIICNDSRRDHQIGAMVYALNFSRADRPVYVVADEAPSYLDKPRDILGRMVFQGRHAGFGMLLIGQRPASVWAEYRSQAKATYWMRIRDHADLETAKKTIGPEKAASLPTLAQGEFIKHPE